MNFQALLYRQYEVAQLVEALRYKSIPGGVIEIFFHWHNPSGRTTAPGVNSDTNRNEYQEYFLGVKAAGALGWQPYHLHVPIVLKSGSLNLLEPSGPVQACNGIAFKVGIQWNTI